MRPTRPLRAGPATPYACTTLADCGHLNLHRRDRLCVGFTLGADVLTRSQIGSTGHGKPEETVSDGLVTRATSYAKDEAPRTPRPFMRAQGPRSRIAGRACDRSCGRHHPAGLDLKTLVAGVKRATVHA